jgi:toxin ParE1/3/4
MSHELRILPAAESDLEDLFDYISRHSSRGRAVAYVQRLQDACFALCDHPYRGRAREDLSSGLRSISVAGRAVIVYRVADDLVEIIHICYAGRDYGPDDFQD